MRDKIIEKILSGRFIMVIGFTIATCYGFIIKIVPPEAFMLLVGIIVKSYFERSDRPNGNGGAK